MKDSRVSVLTYLTLFSSSSTLICCALPAVFVTFGAGAAFASITEGFPLLFVLVANKVWLFWGTGALLFSFLVLFFTETGLLLVQLTPYLQKHVPG